MKISRICGRNVIYLRNIEIIYDNWGNVSEHVTDCIFYIAIKIYENLHLSCLVFVWCRTMSVRYADILIDRSCNLNDENNFHKIGIFQLLV